MELPSADEPLEVRVASISAEIAAAIAQAQSRAFAEAEEEESESGSGQEMGRQGLIGPNTSDVRGEEESGGGREDEDSDAFPAPLRTRRSRDGEPVAGTKRKR